MHEGASGGGKSEMNEHLHRNPDGSLFLGRNIITEDERHITLPRGCELRPVADDMAIAHTKLQKNNGKLTILDAEHSWFIRVDHIKNYGTDPDIEARAIHPEKPLLFLNIDTQPNTTALLWEHIEDAPGKPCPNPRFILPRDIVPSIVSKPLSVDIRSFGVRTPPCTKENPNYGILGLFHILPPALAWLWRLVSPRGHDNPSIVDSGGMQSEGVGSYWPFATGKKIVQANLLLEQFIASNKVLNVLCPIKHIGAWNVGFMPQWIMREYITRRGDAFLKSDLKDSRCPLLGYSLKKLVIEGQELNKIFLLPEMQSEVGLDAYDKGAQILTDFFKKELSNFNSSELHSVGKKIIDYFMSNGSVSDYEEILPCENLFEQE
jgi:hypothetical protein